MTKIGAYDADGIWGIGDTEDEAKDRATAFLRAAVAPGTLVDALAAIKFAPISDDLLKDGLDDDDEVSVITQADIPHKLADGVLVPDPDGDGDEGDEDDEEEEEE